MKSEKTIPVSLVDLTGNRFYLKRMRRGCFSNYHPAHHHRADYYRTYNHRSYHYPHPPLRLLPLPHLRIRKTLRFGFMTDLTSTLGNQIWRLQQLLCEIDNSKGGVKIGNDYYKMDPIILQYGRRFQQGRCRCQPADLPG